MNKKQTLEINWHPDKNSAVPAYQQIVDFFLSSVSSGAFPIGMKLPSQRKLSEIFMVNRSTVSTAIAELSSYGVLKGSYGAGTEISSNTWSLLLKGNQNWSRHVLSGTFKENISTLQTIAYNVKKDLPFHKNGIMHLFEGSCRFHQKDQICDAA